MQKVGPGEEESEENVPDTEKSIYEGWEERQSMANSRS